MHATLVFLFGLSLSFFTIPAHSATIAIVDSGTDIQNEEFKGKLWNNPTDPADAVDNDWNGYVDDLHGWNFADGNSKLINRKLLDTFSTDVYKFFEIQLKIINKNASKEEEEWYKNLRTSTSKETAAFFVQLQTFGNFVHGTHVAGLTAKDAPNAKIMALKIMKTEAKSIAEAYYKASLADSKETKPSKFIDFLLRQVLGYLAGAQSQGLAKISQYLKEYSPQVANCSFGTSAKMLEMMVIKPLLQMFLRREPTADELKTYSAFFVNKIIDGGGSFATHSPNTFFVIAAGNDGVDNAEYPTYPANLRKRNTLTVAATNGYESLAPFSNYSTQFVDVAAPGVGILSGIPGNKTLRVSGTSQATPFVANVVGRMFDENPKLSFEDLREILIKTVDYKDFLKGKVKAEGIVNVQRAIFAAKLSVSQNVASAITEARMSIGDYTEAEIQTPKAGGSSSVYEDAYYLMPLAPLVVW